MGLCQSFIEPRILEIDSTAFVQSPSCKHIIALMLGEGNLNMPNESSFRRAQRHRPPNNLHVRFHHRPVVPSAEGSRDTSGQRNFFPLDVVCFTDGDKFFSLGLADSRFPWLTLAWSTHRSQTPPPLWLRRTCVCVPHAFISQACLLLYPPCSSSHNRYIQKSYHCALW